MDSAFSAMLKTALTSFIGRIILAGFTLVIVPILPTLINFTNDVLGYNLTDGQVTSYAKNAALGVAALAATWLWNRGRFEAAAVAGQAVIEAGKATGVSLDRTEHQPGEFTEQPLQGEGGNIEAQKAGFQVSTRKGNPTVPPGIRDQQE